MIMVICVRRLLQHVIADINSCARKQNLCPSQYSGGSHSKISIRPMRNLKLAINEFLMRTEKTLL